MEWYYISRRFQTGYEDGKYSLIAGHVDAGETFTECIIREAKEEANITLDPENLNAVHIMHRNSNPNDPHERVDIFFMAKKWIWELRNMEPEKCDDLSWFDLDNLPSNILPYVKEAITYSQDNVTYSEYWW